VYKQGKLYCGTAVLRTSEAWPQNVTKLCGSADNLAIFSSARRNLFSPTS